MRLDHGCACLEVLSCTAAFGVRCYYDCSGTCAIGKIGMDSGWFHQCTVQCWLQISDMCHWHAIGHGISNQRRKALEEKKKCLSFFSFRQELSQEWRVTVSVLSFLGATGIECRIKSWILSKSWSHHPQFSPTCLGKAFGFSWSPRCRSTSFAEE